MERKPLEDYRWDECKWTAQPNKEGAEAKCGGGVACAGDVYRKGLSCPVFFFSPPCKFEYIQLHSNHCFYRAGVRFAGSAGAGSWGAHCLPEEKDDLSFFAAPKPQCRAPSNILHLICSKSLMSVPNPPQITSDHSRGPPACSALQRT